MSPSGASSRTLAREPAAGSPAPPHAPQLGEEIELALVDAIAGQSDGPHIEGLLRREVRARLLRAGLGAAQVHVEGHRGTWQVWVQLTPAAPPVRMVSVRVG